MDWQQTEINVLNKLIKTKRTVEFLSHLKAEYFLNTYTREVFETILDEPEITVSRIKSKLADNQFIKSGLLTYDVDVYGIDDEIIQLKKLYRKDKLKKLGSWLQKEAEKDPDEAMLGAEKALSAIARSNDRELGEMADVYERYVKDRKFKEALYFGVEELDNLTGGVRKGQVWVVGAGTGVGKSVFVSDFALKQSMLKKKVLFFSTEMTAQGNLGRLGFMMMEYNQANNIDHGVEMVREMKHLHLYDKLRTFQEIRNEIIRQDQLGKVDLIIVDHLQDMSAKGQNQFELLNTVSTEFKDLAIDLNQRLILVSQLSRSGDTQSKNAFWGSGKIEQIAHVAMILSELKDRDDLLACCICKNRGVVDNPKTGTGIMFLKKTKYLAMKDAGLDEIDKMSLLGIDE